VANKYNRNILEMTKEGSVLYPYVSVDCVVFGFDGETLKVLLIERKLITPTKI